MTRHFPLRICLGLLAGGLLACSDDGGTKPVDDGADGTSPVDTFVPDTVADTDGTIADTDLPDVDTGGDTFVPTDTDVIDTDTGGPVAECDKAANVAHRNSLLAAQPVLEGRSRGPITAAVSWASLADDDTESCSVTLSFKDSNGNGSLDAYENWTLTPAERAADLVARMSPAEKLGLTLHPYTTDAPTLANNAVAAATSTLVTAQHARFGVTTAVTKPISARATWANNLQELCEGENLGIPFVISAAGAHSAGDGRSKTSGFSRWPHELGLAAADDLGVIETFGGVAAQEYGAIGIRLALDVSADLATDPRAFAEPFTFGEDDAAVATALGRYLKGLQGDDLATGGVAAVVGHYPGAGATVGGLDPRLAKGKHLVFPGGAFDDHAGVFEAAIDAGAVVVMPAYGIPKTGSWTGLGGVVDGATIEQVGASFNKTLLTDALRGHGGFDGMVLAPRGVLEDAGTSPLGAPWGVESLTKAQRAAKAVGAGVDQFLGLADPAPLAAAKTAGDLTDAQLDAAATRALTLMFRLGLFEDPYVDPSAANALVNTDPSYRAGLNAMNRSMVLLVNADKPAGWLNSGGDGTQTGDKGNAGNGSLKILPAPPGEPYVRAGCSYFILGDFDLDYVRSVSAGYGELTNDATEIDGVPVTTPEQRIARSDYVFIRVPAACTADPDAGALTTCGPSLTYAGSENADVLDLLGYVRDAIDALPSSQTQIVVGVDGGRAPVVSEVLGYGVTGLYMTWSVTDKVFLDVAFGIVNGSGKLPVGIPLSNAAAASQLEDVAGDGQHATFVRGFGLTTTAF
ncbi:MAG: glycoside hydrolase family 3 protein [Deltaproteobacteria bacterium]|nr:glycoside hydrolase family 3 protein [Deltaproteobacteria bacterium]